MHLFPKSLGRDNDATETSAMPSILIFINGPESPHTLMPSFATLLFPVLIDLVILGIAVTLPLILHNGDYLVLTDLAFLVSISPLFSLACITHPWYHYCNPFMQTHKC